MIIRILVFDFINMSSQTAARWFVPDDEYYRGTDDYLFCLQGSGEVKSLFRRLEDRDDLPEDNLTVYEYMKSWGLWYSNKGGNGCLIYADAKDRDIKERENFIRARAKIPLLDELPEDLQEVDKQLIKWVYKNEMEDLTSQEDSEDLSAEEKSIARHIIKRQTGRGFICSNLIDYVVMQDDSRIRTDLLTLLSGQGYIQTPRPTILLIAVVDDVFTAPGPRQKGVVTAYDMVKEVFITRSYAFDRNQYVFAESWSSKDSEDGFYACDTAKSFVSGLPAPDSVATADKSALLKFYIQRMVCKWLQKHKEVFKFSEENVTRLQKHAAAVKEFLKSQKVPALEQHVLAEKSDVIMDLSALLEQVELMEDHLRDMAVRAKEDGLATTADNLAKHFDKTVRDLTQMVEHPELPLQD